MEKRKGGGRVLRLLPITQTRLSLALFFIFTSVLSINAIPEKSFGSTVADVVTYREWPEDGGSSEDGRAFKAEGNAHYGIDINSRVDLEIDKAQLKRRLADKVPGGLSERAVKVQERILKLDETSRQINGSIVLLQQSFDEFNRATKDPRLWGQAIQSIQEFNARMGSIIGTLKKAIGLRLESEGTVENEKKQKVDAKINPIYIPGGAYNWQELIRLYYHEMAELDKELEKLIPELDKMQIEIQGHIFRSGELQGEPIHLPRYNEIKECVPAPVKKVTFNVPNDQLELFNDYSKSVKTMGDASSLAEAIRMRLEVDAKRLNKSLEQSLEATGAAVKAVEQSAVALKFWTDKDNVDSWIREAKKQIGSSQEGKEILAEYEQSQKEFSNIYRQARYDIDVMTKYEDLRSTISGQAPDEAMITIMKEINNISYQVIQVRQTGKAELLLPDALRPATWLARKESVEKLLKRMKNSEPSLAAQLKSVKFEDRNPIQDAIVVAESFHKMVFEVNKVSPEIPVWLAQVLQLPPVIAASELPRPSGQERFAIVTEDLSTSFDLQTICGPRSEFDRVRITYKLFNNNKELDPGWHNDFQLRNYGWEDSVIAGISFTKQRSVSTYKPAASLSWILDYTCWPDKDRRGVAAKNNIDWFSGFGLTSMALDFDPNQDAELGLGLTLSFLNNRILAGYGWNLQAREQSGFVFFSINLFQTNGMFPVSGKQN